MKKILFLGLNKTGTTSLHHAFLKIGMNSYHGKEWIHWLNHDVALDHQVYCDGSCENINLSKLNPEKHTFVLNTRSLSNWLKSRCKHAYIGYKRGNRVNYTIDNIVNWINIRKEWHRKINVLRPFIFNIEDIQSHKDLCDYLNLDLKIDHTNKSQIDTDVLMKIHTDVVSVLKDRKINDWNEL